MFKNESNKDKLFIDQIDNIFYNSCKYDYFYIVYYILENTYYDINTVIIIKMIFILFYFFFLNAYSFKEQISYLIVL